MSDSIENAKCYFEFGLSLFEQKDFLSAKETFLKALEYAPDRPSILINLSATLIQLKEWVECEKVCYKILSLDSNNYDSLLNLSSALSHMDRTAEALQILNKATTINPDIDSGWVNKGNIFEEIEDLEQADKCFSMALSINPSSQEAFIGRGNLRNKKKEYQSALEDFNKALGLNPNSSQAKWNKALSLLRLGDFIEGWKLYESRWEIDGMREYQKHLNIPLWLGGGSLKNKTVLIWAEQGYGDTIQFSRYLPILEKMGATVFFEAPKPLINLMRTLSQTIQVIENGSIANFILSKKIDFQCPVMSLALALETTLENIPNQCPYLHVDKEKVDFWRNKLATKNESEELTHDNFKVGITWNGSGHYAGKKNLKRNLNPKEIAKLIRSFDDPNIEFHSLQIEESKNNIVKALVSEKFFSHEKFLLDFSDTAALLTQMDLILSIDTATAHLAGALNMATLLLIPEPPDFMALVDRVDSPWYPSIKLIRQEKVGIWPIDTIVDSIKKIRG